MLTEECQIPTPRRWTSVPEMQRRLAEKANEQPDHRFGNLFDLLTWETVLDEAATRLRTNKGSRTAGLDGIDRRILEPEYRARHIARLREQLRRGTFQPSPVKRVYIPKKNGKMRPLGIPTLYDRWVQMALKLILEPIFESDFATYSHGFRPQRSCHTAAAHIHSLTRIRKRKYYWVIEGDIEGCFDHVHHKKLMSLLRQRIQDTRLLDLIWRFLRAGMMEGTLFKRTDTGTPQGGVLSPLLANIYLNHFDQWFAQRAMLGTERIHERAKHRKAGHGNAVMVRYADDFVVFSNGTKDDAAAFKEEMKTWLRDELALTLSEEKTAITHFTDGFDFLGFTFKKTTARDGNREVVVHYPSTASVQRAIRRVAELTDRRHANKSHEDQIEALNTFLRGWGAYFRHSSAKRALSYVGYHAFMRMWAWLVVKDNGNTRRGWKAAKAKYRRDNTWVVGKHRLLVLASLPVEYPKHLLIPNPYLMGEGVPDAEHVDLYRHTWMGQHAYGPDWTPNREAVLEAADQQCVMCGENTDVEVHHVKARRKGGGNEARNLVPLCTKHHAEAKRRNSVVSHQVRKKIPGSGEPDARKRASPVRGEGL